MQSLTHLHAQEYLYAMVTRLIQESLLQYNNRCERRKVFDSYNRSVWRYL